MLVIHARCIHQDGISCVFTHIHEHKGVYIQGVYIHTYMLNTRVRGDGSHALMDMHTHTHTHVCVFTEKNTNTH